MLSITPAQVAYLNTFSLPAAIIVAACVLGVCYVFGSAIGGRR